MPFKTACIPLVDKVHPSAAAIQSINTIVNDAGVLHAYNTDYLAISQLLHEAGISVTSSIAVRGSGGMAKAVAHAARDAGFVTGVVIARNEAQGRHLANACGYRWQAELGDLLPQVLINATPIGMAGGADGLTLAFADSAIDQAMFVFDVIAMPAETPLIRQARSLGTALITGADVTVRQAVEQFVLYTGLRPTPVQIERAFEIAAVALR